MGNQLSEQEEATLRQIAFDSIEMAVAQDRPLAVSPEESSPRLQEPGAVFVTLKIKGELRGCIGSMEARRPLIEDVAANAFSAAVRDPRFPPLSETELGDLDYHISLLTPPEPLEVRDREELLTLLRPGVDGLLLEDPPHRATFLPQVWEALPSPNDFLDELFLKGGMARDHWTDTLRLFRYTVQEF